jgi:F-type H+-transporting ATPase subunit epsilon
MTTFHLTISSAETLIYDGPSVYCTINPDSGSLGIEPGHEPFLGVLKENSHVRFKDESGTEKTIAVESGLIYFRNNRCVLTVSVPPVTP